MYHDITYCLAKHFNKKKCYFRRDEKQQRGDWRWRRRESNWNSYKALKSMWHDTMHEIMRYIHHMPYSKSARNQIIWEKKKKMKIENSLPIKSKSSSQINDGAIYKNIVIHSKLWSNGFIANQYRWLVAIADIIAWFESRCLFRQFRFYFLQFMLLFISFWILLKFYALNTTQTTMLRCSFIRSMGLPEDLLTRSRIRAFHFIVIVNFSFLHIEFLYSFVADAILLHSSFVDSISCHLFHTHVWFDFAICHFNWNSTYIVANTHIYWWR